MPIPFKLDYVIEQLSLALLRAQQRRTLRALAGVRVSPTEAQPVWPHIMEHK